MSLSSCTVYLLILTNLLVDCVPKKASTCDLMRCRREGGAGKARRGHVKLHYLEMPYLAILIGPQGAPFCIGVLLNREEILTTCRCAFHHVYFQIGFGTYEKNYNLKDLRMREKKAIVKHPNCDKTALFHSGDFATVIINKPIDPHKTFHLKSWDTAQTTDMIFVDSEKLTLCYAVGFGGYDFVGPKSDREGKRMRVLHKYNYRLLPDRFCNKYTPLCCGKWLDLGIGKSTIETTGHRCAVRAHHRSQCFGDIGSPIVCKGFIYGFVKGHLRCKDDNKNFAGPDLFLPITNAIKFVRDKYRNNQIYPWLPQPMPRKEVWVNEGGEEGGISVPNPAEPTGNADEEIYDDTPPLIPQDGSPDDYGHGDDYDEDDPAVADMLLSTFFPNETKPEEVKKREEIRAHADDYYYDADATVFRPHLHSIITAIVINYILN